MNSSNNFPLISVITPVYNGQETLERAIRSVRQQTFSAWELLAADDCSTDSSAVLLQSWAEQDARIRLFRTPENSGQCTARNLGLRHARGEYVCYLDQDDEYFADYLATIRQAYEKSDVLVFEYDLVYDDRPPDSPIETWRPEAVRNSMFVSLISTPLGVAHRRSLVEQLGGFNELLWSNEDRDLWRRFARAGAEFRFISQKSGRFHVRANSQSRVRRLTRKQSEAFAWNRAAGRPVFGDRPAYVKPLNIRKVAFASPHCLVDYFNGASIATLHGLQLLQSLGCECQAFCGAQLDAPQEIRIDELLARQKMPFKVHQVQIGDYEARMFFALPGQLPVTIFGSASSRGEWSDDAETAAFLTAYTRFLDQNEPDVVIMYGGNPVAMTMMALTKKRDIPIVFALHNCLYSDPGNFELADYVTVPSEFCRQYYWDTLGLACQKLPNVIDWDRVAVADRQPRYVTYVNPDPNKGVFVFARIAEVLAGRRPDIRLLVVESRGQADLLAEYGLDLRGLPNIQWMKATPDPREFYRVTKFVLMPSLWNEVFPLVPAEAMLSGIPVLGSNRGGIPEVVGAGGFLLDIPACYTPQTRAIPTVEEVEPWVETIIRLWDDAAFYEEASHSARREAERWHPSRIASCYRDFFSNIFHQPGPPLVPQWDKLQELCRGLQE